MMEEQKGVDGGRSDAFWNRVYIAVVVNTVIVIALLWAFGEMFNP